jgi:hypothetical protein
MLLPNGLLISAPGASLSAGVPGSLLGAALLRGLPLPRTPAGVCAPSGESTGGKLIRYCPTLFQALLSAWQSFLYFDMLR